MISTDFRKYNYFLYLEKDEYAQPQMSKESQGQIKMAIYITSQAIQDNINYQSANYVGLTQAAIDDTYVIQYGEEKLKVLYVNPQGRLKQVFLAKI